MDSQGVLGVGTAGEAASLLKRLHDQQEQRLTELLESHARRLEHAFLQGSRMPRAATLSVSSLSPEDSKVLHTWTVPAQTNLPRAGKKKVESKPRVHGNSFLRGWRTVQRTFTRSTVSFPWMGLFEQKVDAVERQERMFKERRKAERQFQQENLTGVNVFAWSLSRSRKFEAFWAAMIVINAVSLGVRLDLCIKGSCDLQVFQVLDYVFTAMFCLELAIRFCAEMRHFFSKRNPNFAWNIFDLVLVLCSLFTDLAESFHSWTTDVSGIRLLRVLRLTRAARLVRVLRLFTNLRLMIVGIASCAQSLLSASFLLLLVIYIYGIMVLQLIADDMSLPENSHAASLNKYYGSLMVTLYTLFGSVSGGLSWQDGAEPLVQVHPYMRLASVFYIMFAVLCVLNVITGVFVENAFKIHNNDEDRAIFDMLEHRKDWIAKVKDLFVLADRRDTGFFDQATFCEVLRDVRVQHCFRKLGLDVEENSAMMLFALFDVHNTGRIHLDEFAEGIQRVHGSARSIDIVQLLQSNRGLTRQLRELTRVVHDLCDTPYKL